MTPQKTENLLLVICDGMGYSDNEYFNAIKAANTPNLDHLYAHYPFTTLSAGGTSVGLPKGIPGNSEVGHMNIGAGRPVRQDLVRINETIKNETFHQLNYFSELINSAQNNTKRIHLLGLLSDGGVHSHIDHIKETINRLSIHKDLQIFFHAFMDGRDTPTDSGIDYVKELLELPGFHFASIQGRAIAMDRDNRWEKIERAYKTLTGNGEMTNEDPVNYLQAQYDKQIFDEFITPTLFGNQGIFKEGDSFFFLNFRPDRAREITLAINDPNFNEFPQNFKPSFFMNMSPCVTEELPKLPVLFDREMIPNTLTEYLNSLGKKVFKLAETEKYAHVTYFLNGGNRDPFPLEERKLIPSPKEVKTYDEKPEMSALKIEAHLQEILKKKEHSLYVVNFANPDMVGHTGNYDAAIKAVEYVDQCLGRIIQTCEEQNITMLITADHGNCDQMKLENGNPHTAHTDAPVPFILFQKDIKDQKIKIEEKEFALKDIAPTIIHLLDLPMPTDFTGTPVFK